LPLNGQATCPFTYYGHHHDHPAKVMVASFKLRLNGECAFTLLAIVVAHSILQCGVQGSPFGKLHKSKGWRNHGQNGQQRNNAQTSVSGISKIRIISVALRGIGTLS